MLPLLLCGHHDCFGLSVQVKRLLQVQCVDYTSVELDQVGESRDPVQLATPTSKINALQAACKQIGPIGPMKFSGRYWRGPGRKP